MKPNTNNNSAYISNETQPNPENDPSIAYENAAAEISSEELDNDQINPDVDYIETGSNQAGGPEPEEVTHAHEAFETAKETVPAPEKRDGPTAYEKRQENKVSPGENFLSDAIGETLTTVRGQIDERVDYITSESKKPGHYTKSQSPSEIYESVASDTSTYIGNLAEETKDRFNNWASTTVEPTNQTQSLEQTFKTKKEPKGLKGLVNSIL